MPGDLHTFRVLVSGRVQGVSFRYYAQQQAQLIGITGWVRNLPDGRVEAMIRGDAASTDRMLAWLTHGPESAVVESCHAEPAEPRDLPDGFHITR